MYYNILDKCRDNNNVTTARVQYSSPSLSRLYCDGRLLSSVLTTLQYKDDLSFHLVLWFSDTGVDSGSCRLRGWCGRAWCGRAWCSRETRQAAVQLVLLCVASCSWTLLLISLTLTSTTTPVHRHVVEVVGDSGPQWSGGSAGACEECLTRRGPPHTYWRVFERPLQQVVAALDRLDRPLAPPALRAHLMGTRTLLRHLASALHLRVMDYVDEDTNKDDTKAAVLAAPGKPNGRFACQEQFLGSKVGYPRYIQGFTRVNCSALPLREVVTAVVWDVEHKHLVSLLSDFNRLYPGLPLLLVTDALVQNRQNLIIERPTPSITQALTRILTHVTTPYVLLAPRLSQLSGHSRLERLVWVAEWARVWAVGGSVRGVDGRWRAGCLQAREAGGQLVYKRGYDASMYECHLCHTLEGPMIMRTTTLATLDWSTHKASHHLLLPELFLEIHAGAAPHQHAAAVCPDSMFLVESLEPPWEVASKSRHQERELRRVAALWQPLAKRRHLARLQLPSGVNINYPCDFLTAIRPTYVTHTFPTPTDKITTAAWACERREVTAILSSLLQACDNLQIKCFLLDPALSAVLRGGEVQGVRSRSVDLGVAEGKVLPRLQRLANITHIGASLEGGSLRIEGRWWAVTVTPTQPTQNAHWTRVEVVSGVWTWAPLNASEGWAAAGGRTDTLLPQLEVLDNSEGEDLAVLTSPHCAQGRSSQLTLKSP
ncbi:uncharacterized protein LOC121863343 [Homarus americanus]|uniref:uncharacterized protein LOC121863343 n=1 Tax=Homarus americanus TaxID=6706 RepID=UPI001C463447|nr:uncharacterized protein LOC121863343 [Homarus americanus]